MPDISPDQVLELLRAPRTIYAPDGTKFVLKSVDDRDASTPDAIFSPAFARYEAEGPDDENHFWMFSAVGPRVSDPADLDTPVEWTAKVEVAVGGSRPTERCKSAESE